VFEMGNHWGKAKGDGEEGGEVSIQSTRDQSGRESHHDTKEGFQVSKKGIHGRRRDFQARGLSNGLGYALRIILILHMVCVLCVCRANKELCLGYK
jgi:hypothetical protein